MSTRLFPGNFLSVFNLGVFVSRREYCERMENEDTQMFCLRVMVGVIILYDHVHPVGAFDKSSGMEVSKSFCLDEVHHHIPVM